MSDNDGHGGALHALRRTAITTKSGTTGGPFDENPEHRRTPILNGSPT